MGKNLIWHNGIPYERPRDEKTGRFIKLIVTLPPLINKCNHCGLTPEAVTFVTPPMAMSSSPLANKKTGCQVICGCGASGPLLYDEAECINHWNEVHY